MKLKMPKLRRQTFETAIIERYQRRESCVEEALIEMYLAGVSVRRVEDITEALWGTRVSPGTVSNLNKKIYAKIDDWRHRPIEGEHPYVFLDGIVMKRTWAGEVRNVSLLVAIGVTTDGYREILRHRGRPQGGQVRLVDVSAAPGDRGLTGVQLIVSDACLGLVESAAECLPDAQWQRCVVHFYRNVFSHGARRQGPRHRQDAEGDPRPGEPQGRGREDRRRHRRTEGHEAGQGRRTARRAWSRDPDLLRLPRQPLDQAQNQQPAGAHHARDPAANPRGRRFPDGKSCLNLAAARLRHIAGHAMVDPEVHEHDPAIRGSNPRSRRRVKTESAKDL